MLDEKEEEEEEKGRTKVGRAVGPSSWAGATTPPTSLSSQRREKACTVEYGLEWEPEKWENRKFKIQNKVHCTTLPVAEAGIHRPWQINPNPESILVLVLILKTP